MYNHGQPFVERARKEFASIFARFGFREVGALEEPGYSQLVAKNKHVALQITYDGVDERVYVRVSRLLGSRIPPIMMVGARTMEEVTEFEVGILLWQAGWDRDAASHFGELQPGDDPIGDALRENAKMLDRYGGSIVTGDREAWTRVAELMMSRKRPNA